MRRGNLILITLFTILTSACDQQETSISTGSSTEPLGFRCNQQVPEFTLGPQSNPSEEQLNELCSCIWDSLTGWEKSTAIALSEGRKKNVSEMHLRGFPSRFGRAIDACGGASL